MLTFQEFFTACSGTWTTDRTYHYPLEGELERSYTEFKVRPLTLEEKQPLLQISQPIGSTDKVSVNTEKFAENDTIFPGFAIAFDTRSETGEEVSMSLKAVFIPDADVISAKPIEMPLLPVAAQVVTDSSGELIQGFYLRDEGYSEAGAIAGRFTYQPTRQTLEMTTYYKRSVAVDQMRFVAPNLRLRTIVTYQKPEDGTPPTVISLVGFGVERRQAP